MHELHAIYDGAPPEDYRAYQSAAKAIAAAGEGDLLDEEIDASLMKSLQARFS